MQNGLTTLLWIIFGFTAGLCFGSFANVIIYRLPRKTSIISPPSACTTCNHRLAFYDMFPVVSWILLRGHCRHCRSKISSRYPLTELACGLLFAGMVYFTPSLSAVFLSLFSFILLAVSVIDWETQEIPDGLLVTAALVGAGWIAAGHFSDLFPYAPVFIDAVLGIIASGLPLFVIDRLVLLLAKKDGFGYGDVKLMAVCGLFLGWQLVLVAFIIAFISGGMYATFLLITSRAKSGEYIAFGPFLCAGVIGALWFGRALWN